MAIAPSFSGFKSASEAQSKAKRSNRSKNTTPEILLRHELHLLGLRYRVNVRDLPGCPDIVFTKSRVAIFCDGDFWHGRDWMQLRLDLAHRANADYWIRKIEYNRRRDAQVNDRLTREGWNVVRIWEHDIALDPSTSALLVNKVIESKTNSGMGSQRISE